MLLAGLDPIRSAELTELVGQEILIQGEMNSDHSTGSPQLRAASSPSHKPADSPLLSPAKPTLAEPGSVRSYTDSIAQPFATPSVPETARPEGEKKILHVQGSGTYLARALNL